jgi:surface-anchored protein
MNWAFTRPGRYTLWVEACGRPAGPEAALGQVCSELTPYAVEVRSEQ